MRTTIRLLTVLSLILGCRVDAQPATADAYAHEHGEVGGQQWPVLFSISVRVAEEHTFSVIDRPLLQEIFLEDTGHAFSGATQEITWTQQPATGPILGGGSISYETRQLSMDSAELAVDVDLSFTYEHGGGWPFFWAGMPVSVHVGIYLPSRPFPQQFDQYEGTVSHQLRSAHNPGSIPASISLFDHAIRECGDYLNSDQSFVQDFTAGCTPGRTITYGGAEYVEARRFTLSSRLGYANSGPNADPFTLEQGIDYAASFVVRNTRLDDPPVAEIVGPYPIIGPPVDSITVGDRFGLHGRDSYDPDNANQATDGIVLYEWYDLTDGQRTLITSGENEDSLLLEACKVGVQTYELVVTDDEGLTDSARVDVDVVLPHEQPVVFSDSDRSFQPESRFVALTGTSQAPNQILEIVFIDTNCVELRRVVAFAAADRMWEKVVEVPDDAAHIYLQPGTGAFVSPPCDWADISPASDVLDIPTGVSGTYEDYERLRTADVCLAVGVGRGSVWQRIVHGGEYSHAFMYVGPDENGTPMIAQSGGAPDSGRMNPQSAARAGVTQISLFMQHRPLDEQASKSSSLDLYTIQSLSQLERQSISDTALQIVSNNARYWNGTEMALYVSAWNWYSEYTSNYDPVTGQLLSDAVAVLQQLSFPQHGVQSTPLVCSQLPWLAYKSGAGIDLVQLNQAPNVGDTGTGVSGEFWPGVAPDYLEYLAQNNALLWPDTLASGAVLVQYANLDK